MARKCKVGIDYFSHDVDMLQDKKMKLIKAKHGLVGYAVYLRLLEEIYKSNGYYLIIDEDFNILFSDDNNIDYNVYILILNDCINKDLFSKTHYEKLGILTSRRIQENYCTATERRKEVDFIRDYLIIDVSKFYKDDIVVNIINLNVDINSLNVDGGTQSKVDNTKVDKNKEYTADFEEFYSLYPRPFNKQSTFTNFKNTLRTDSFENIMIATRKYIEVLEEKPNGTDKQYIKKSTNFVGQQKEYKGYLEMAQQSTQKQLELSDTPRTPCPVKHL